MAERGADKKVPKPYRYRLHRLKIEFRRLYRREPKIPRPTTDEAARRVIALLEDEIRKARLPPSVPRRGADAKPNQIQGLCI